MHLRAALTSLPLTTLPLAAPAQSVPPDFSYQWTALAAPRHRPLRAQSSRPRRTRFRGRLRGPRAHRVRRSLNTIATLIVVTLGTCLVPTNARATTAMIYWADFGTDKIQRANADGTDIQDVVTGLGDPVDVAVDEQAGKVYWVDFGTDKIQRARC